MKKIIWVVLIFVIIGVVFGSFVYLYTFRKADLSVASKKADIEIKAADLLKNFTEKEDSANTAYLDKILSVNGIIDKVTEDSASITVYLKNPEDVAGVMCCFHKSTIDKSTLQPGTAVYVKGICTGYLMDVVLNKCAVVK
jgi:uncharacterized protein YpmB